MLLTFKNSLTICFRKDRPEKLGYVLFVENYIRNVLVILFNIDELIRQVTISCQERGLLLLRVRDEIRMSIAAYQTLYESSVAFGMRKALQAEQGKTDMETRIKDLEEEKRQLEQTVLDLKNKCEAIEKRESERRAMEERKHAEEIAFLKKTNVQLKTQLEGILTPQNNKKN